MAENSGEEKTLPPSASKLMRLRQKEGQAAHSVEMLTAGVLVAILVYVCISFNYIIRQLYIPLLTDPFSTEGSFVSRAGDLWTLVMTAGLNIVGPLLITIIVTALFVSIIDTRGIVFSSKAITPSFKKINPASNIKNIFSVSALITIAKDVVRISLLLGGVFLIFLLTIKSLMFAPSCGQNCALQVYAVLLLSVICLGVALVILAAIIDIPVSRFLFKRENKMTISEMKQETKEQFGHPMTRTIRQAVRQEARAAAPTGIGRANFIVIAPDVAIALRYNTLESPLPIVVTKTRSPDEIKKLDDYCRVNNIPRVYDAQLARKMAVSALGTYPPVDTFNNLAAYLVAIKLANPQGQE
jgi:type III secretion protein U